MQLIDVEELNFNCRIECYVDDENILKNKCKTMTKLKERHNKNVENDPGRQNNGIVEENAFPAPRV